MAEEKQQFFRLSVDLKIEFDKWCEVNGKKQSEVLTGLIKDLLHPTKKSIKSDDKPTLKEIITKYAATCSKEDCRRFIPAGSRVYWGPGVVICEDCMIKSQGSKTLARGWLKIREMKMIIKDLTEQADNLANEVDEERDIKQFSDLGQKIDELIRLSMDYLRNIKPQGDERQTLERINELLSDIERAYPQLADLLKARLKRKKKWIPPPLQESE